MGKASRDAGEGIQIMDKKTRAIAEAFSDGWWVMLLVLGVAVVFGW